MVSSNYVPVTLFSRLRAGTTSGLSGSRVGLAVVAVETQARGSAVAAALDRTHTHHLGVDRTRHTVRNLDVELGEHVL